MIVKELKKILDKYPETMTVLLKTEYNTVHIVKVEPENDICVKKSMAKGGAYGGRKEYKNLTEGLILKPGRYI